MCTLIHDLGLYSVKKCWICWLNQPPRETSLQEIKPGEETSLQEIKPGEETSLQEIKPGEETSLQEVKTGLQVNFKSFWYYYWLNQVVLDDQC